jgi:4'-phosphopantetheinyl transferase
MARVNSPQFLNVKDGTHTLWSPPPDPLNLQPSQVDVWRISLDLPTATVKSLESTLSADETQHAARFHFLKDSHRYIAAHGCLRNILARYLRCEPGQLSFSTNEYGKPVLEERELEFNLSHSSDFALIAVSRGHKVGVDVERVRQDIELESIASRFFSQNEVAEMMVLSPDRRAIAFFNCWTRKEAYIKAHGLGLSLLLENFDVSLTPNEPAILRATRPDPEEAARWELISLEVDPCYAAAIAVHSVALRPRPAPLYRDGQTQADKLEFRLWDWNRESISD